MPIRGSTGEKNSGNTDQLLQNHYSSETLPEIHGYNISVNFCFFSMPS